MYRGRGKRRETKRGRQRKGERVGWRTQQSPKYNSRIIKNKDENVHNYEVRGEKDIGRSERKREGRERVV